MIAALVLAASISAIPDTPHRRIALLVANNDGGAGLDDLKYAEDDARQIADVLQQLGGVVSTELLIDSSADGLDRAFDGLIRSMRDDGRPTTLFFFYSGHADSGALLMNGSRYPFDRLRKRLEASSARLFVAFIDACESGNIIRPKGGRPVPMVDLDLSHLDRSLEGGVMLASTSAGELAQESDELRGSFFTHYLVSGLRGGADISGDRRVSLDEVYQFVYQHTLDRTRASRLGPQHPAYGMKVDGRGELVLTWMNEGASYLILPGPTEGTYFVRDSKKGRIVAEVDKRAGTELRVALLAGRYEVSRIDGLRIWASEVNVAERAELRFDESTMRSSPLRTPQAKGARSDFAVGVSYTLSSGYLEDAGPHHGTDLRFLWRMRWIELGVVATFSTTGYARSDAISVRLWELGAGAFAQLAFDVYDDLRAFLGAEVRWLWARQNATAPTGATQRGEGSIVPMVAVAGLSYPIAPITLVASVETGPALFDGPAGLTASWTVGGRLGVQLGF